MKRAQIIYTDGSTKPVKNLGWLLRNWKWVKQFTIINHPEINFGCQPDCVLTAHLKDGRKYETGFMSHSLLRHFLDRPVFRGLLIDDQFQNPQSTEP